MIDGKEILLSLFMYEDIFEQFDNKFSNYKLYLQDIVYSLALGLNVDLIKKYRILI